jgi:hypothetical protein
MSIVNLRTVEIMALIVYEDYDSMIYTMSDNPNPQDIIISKLTFSQQINFKRY